MSSPTGTRIVVVIRHAHAGDGPGNARLEDHERELDQRGRREATAAGQWLAGWLADRDVTPDLVLVSDATRTRQTWAGIAAELAAVPPPTFEPRIYRADVEELVEVLSEPRARLPVVVLVGHNPAVSELAWFLGGHAGPDLVPAAVAAFSLGADADLRPGDPLAGFVPER